MKQLHMVVFGKYLLVDPITALPVGFESIHLAEKFIRESPDITGKVLAMTNSKMDVEYLRRSWKETNRELEIKKNEYNKLKRSLRNLLEQS